MGGYMAGWQVEEEDHDLPPEDWKQEDEGDAQQVPEDNLLKTKRDTKVELQH